MRGRRRRRCRYCRDLFVPDPRVKNQRACDKPMCSRARHDEADRKWRRKPSSREYFRGRYDYLKTWLSKPENRGYLRRYRQKRREQAAANDSRAREPGSPAVAPWARRDPAERSDIQDA